MLMELSPSGCDQPPRYGRPSDVFAALPGVGRGGSAA